MWHEARKQERMIRGMIVDYRRRAERRKDFYEKIKADPTQFLQLHGRPCKIHLDPAVAAAGEGPAIMMPWQGDTTNMIDRFDVRAHLDYIPDVKTPDVPPEDLNTEERQCNYERYRILAQNAFLGISETKFLQQLAIEEQFGVTIEEKETQKEKLNEKKGTGVAIGYNYNDPTAQPSCSNGPEVKKVDAKESDDDSDLEIIDVDLSIDVNKMEASQAHELNAVGPQFGMAGCDLFSFLTGDADDAEHQKQLLREEKEKAMYSGRKSRRERRAHRDKKLLTRVVSPPSYAAPRAPSPAARSPSRSVSPVPDNIQFITSFGGDDDDVKPPPLPKFSYAEKVKQNLKKIDLYSDVVRKARARSSSSPEGPRPMIGPVREHSRSKSRSLSRSKSRSRSRSKSKSRSRSRSKSRGKSYSRDRSYSRSRSLSSRSRSRSYSPYRRSRSRNRSYRNRRSHSPNNSAKRRSRSMSYESDRPSKPTVSRYYGRRKEDKSSSELSLDSDSSDTPDDSKNKSAVNKANSNQNQYRLSGSSSKSRPSRETLSLKEKLKRKMQAQLSRQLRADKRAEAERLERESRRQARRDEEMRELAIKLRRKQREMRHLQSRRSSEEDSDRSRSRSSSRQSPTVDKAKSKSRSKSTSPPGEKRVPVWETNREPFRPKYQEEQERRLEEYRRPDEYRRPEEYRRPDQYREERRPDEDKPYYQNRYDRHPNPRFERHDNYNRQEYPENKRWEDRRFQPGQRRPYGHRGGYRGYGHRPMDHGDGPSWQNSQDYDRNSSDNSKKIKLVDY